MRRITGAVFLSLDGVMQAPGGPSEDYTGGFDEGGWLFRIGNDGIFDTIGSLFAGDYDLLLGRRTYDIFAAYWPYVEGDGAEMGRAFTRAGKHVLTRGDQPLEWENSYRLGGIDDVAALKQSDGPDLINSGVEHNLSGPARRWSDRPADANDLPGDAWAWQAPIRGRHAGARVPNGGP
jgi:dihydrofolate reductase